MGYTLEFWVAPPGVVTAELARPTIDPFRVDFATYGPTAAALATHWSTAAATTAAAVTDGGGALGGTLALYVHFVVRTVGAFQGSLDHSSAGGDDFRRRFLPGPAAELLGLQTLGTLLNRAIAGLTWSDLPSFGWAAAAELQPVVAGFPADLRTLSDDEDDVLSMITIDRATRRAVQLGWDLITAYG